jgi:hypothetical protein
MTEVNGATDPNRINRDKGDVVTHPDRPPAQKVLTPLPVPPEGAASASFGPLPRVRTDVPRARVAAVEMHSAESPSDIQMRMDAFLKSATPTYRVEGQDVPVPIPFRMTVVKGDSTNPWTLQERVVEAKMGELRAAATSVRLGDEDHLNRLRCGRCSPDEIRRVTQALIDRGCLPASSPETRDVPSRVRKMMFDHGIGIDCASFTQQDFLASRGLRRSESRLAPEIMNENLTHLSHEGFTRIDIDHAGPGDIVVLRAAQRDVPGHTLLLYDRRDATPEEVAVLRREARFGTGHVTAFVLDSSWGSEANSDTGGVQRQTWWHDEETDQWAQVSTDTAGRAFDIWPKLYRDHEIIGAYRPSQEAQ